MRLVLRALSPSDDEQVEDRFLDALALARSQSALGLELVIRDRHTGRSTTGAKGREW